MKISRSQGRILKKYVVETYRRKKLKRPPKDINQNDQFDNAYELIGMFIFISFFALCWLYFGYKSDNFKNIVNFLAIIYLLANAFHNYGIRPPWRSWRRVIKQKRVDVVDVFHFLNLGVVFPMWTIYLVFYIEILSIFPAEITDIFPNWVEYLVSIIIPVVVILKRIESEKYEARMYGAKYL